MSLAEQLNERYSGHMKVAARIGLLGRSLLAGEPRAPAEAVIRWLCASILRSHAASITLVTSGFSADAIKVARSMFEVLVTIRTLIMRPDRIEDFVYFDDVVRWQRLETYRTCQPEMYGTIPTEAIACRRAAFEKVRDRFLDRAGRVRSTWHNSNLVEMAREVDLVDMYQIFYRYASSLHHSDAMGLSMLADVRTFEIEIEPSLRLAGVALMVANTLITEGLSAYARARAMPTSSEEPREYAELRELISSEPLKDEDGIGSFAVLLNTESESLGA
jgi:hypothetical protein